MSEPIRKPDDGDGQNPIWPGEEIKGPGTVVEDEEHDEETIIPVVQ